MSLQQDASQGVANSLKFCIDRSVCTYEHVGKKFFVRDSSGTQVSMEAIVVVAPLNSISYSCGGVTVVDLVTTINYAKVFVRPSVPRMLAAKLESERQDGVQRPSRQVTYSIASNAR